MTNITASTNVSSTILKLSTNLNIFKMNNYVYNNYKIR